MKRNNKKGFTIVELVIVIGVIAILSAVLIPTFSGVTKDAKDAANKAEARNQYTQYIFDNPDYAVDYVKLVDDENGNKATYYDVAKGFELAKNAIDDETVHVLLKGNDGKWTVTGYNYDDDGACTLQTCEHHPKKTTTE